MRAGEDIDVGRGADLAGPLPPARIVEFILAELPAGQCRGVAMHDTDAQAGDLDDQMHRQIAQPRARGLWRSIPQQVQNLIRACDDFARYAPWIGAAAARANVA